MMMNQMLFTIMIIALAPVASKSILQRNSCAAEDAFELSFLSGTQDDHCPASAPALEPSPNSTSVTSLSKAIRSKLQLSSQISQRVSGTTSPTKAGVLKTKKGWSVNSTTTKVPAEKPQIKLRDLKNIQSPSSQKTQIKLQKRHEMQSETRQIEGEDTSKISFVDEDQCPATAPTLVQPQLNSTSLHATSHEKSQLKLKAIKGELRNLIQPSKASSQNRQIKLQKPHKMRPQRRQIKVKSSKLVGKTMPSPRKFQSLLNAPGQVSKEEVSLDLLSKLKETFRPGADHSRITLWEETLQPLYLSLPKNEHATLGHAAARYVLHRAFVRRHGWSLKGLEPRNASAPSNAAVEEWVPSYLLDTIERLLDTDGIDLQELAVLAATFEDIAHKEELRRLREVYEEMNLPIDGRIKREAVDEVISMYMAVYTSNETTKDVKAMGFDLDPDTQKWLQGVQSKVTSSFLRLSGTSGTKHLDFKTTGRIVEEIGEQYSNFNDFECKALKKTLLELEDEAKPGMVRLSDFYQKGRNQSYWNFREDISYLRVLGALEESSSGPHVVIPNYVAGESNCLRRSGLYNVCCRSECESLMEKLEEKFRAPSAEADQIVKVIAQLPSDTVAAPRSLSSTMVNGLESIAASNDGVVPLHGREFAHWMHHAFPRECPLPHHSYENPETPDEWLRESSEESTGTSQEELKANSESASANPVPKARRLTTRSVPLKTRKLATRKVHKKARQLATGRLSKKQHLKAGLSVESDSEKCETTKFSLGHSQAKSGSQNEVKSSSKLRLVTSQLNFKGAVETFDADMFLDASNEATSYWEQADRVQQQSDNEALPSIPTPIATMASSDHESRVSVTAAVESSLQKNSALVLLGLLLSIVAVHASFSKTQGSQKVKMDDPENPSHRNYDMNLVRLAAAASVRQRPQVAGTSDWV
jgi:hypothetical protein